ncbi:MAG: metallophosphoesterase [Clostridia bacterium]|nr:metallophosphoesterase [Clostridia bacterium]
MKLKIVIFLVIFMSIIAVFLVLQNNWVKVSRYRINVLGLPKKISGFRIVHISDLHGKYFGVNNKRLANIIKKQNPDMIICSGDMINSQGDDGSAFIDLLDCLAGSCPVYCSLGNHEQMVRYRNVQLYDEFAKRIEQTGACLLDNTEVQVNIKGYNIKIYGFTSRLYHYSSSDTIYLEGSALNRGFIRDSLGERDYKDTTILLAHDPKWLGAYADWGADIIFSGHIHGGVIRIPFKGGLLSPDITWFPKYDSGIYQLGQSIMHVSRGLGNSIIPFRVFNRPNVGVVILESN